MIEAQELQAVADRLHFTLTDTTLEEPLTVNIEGDNSFTFQDNGCGILLLTLTVPLTFWDSDEEVDNLLRTASSKDDRPVRYTIAFLGDIVNFIVHMGFEPSADEVVDTIEKLIQCKKDKFIFPDKEED